MQSNLTDRQKKLLHGIIQHYIETASPVASDVLVENGRLKCSPATVRNEMAVLDELGYLQQPHTSAGRIPTDRGYRFYVDGLMHQEPVTHEEKQGIRKGIKRANGNAFLVFEEVSTVLSKISRELAIVMTPQISHSVFDRLELVELNRNKVLTVIHVRSRLVKTVILEIDVDVQSHDLDNTTRLLNERLSGLTLEEIKKHIRFRLGDRLGGDRGVLRKVVESASDLFDFTGPLEVHTSGSQNIISQPEFTDKCMLQTIFAFLEDKKGLVNLVRFMDQDPSVAIGTENRDTRLKPFSVVASFYRMGSNTGVVGIIGPTRMRYGKIMPLVNCIAHTMTEYMST